MFQFGKIGDKIGDRQIVTFAWEIELKRIRGNWSLNSILTYMPNTTLEKTGTPKEKSVALPVS